MGKRIPCFHPYERRADVSTPTVRLERCGACGIAWRLDQQADANGMIEVEPDEGGEGG